VILKKALQSAVWPSVCRGEPAVEVLPRRNPVGPGFRSACASELLLPCAFHRARTVHFTVF